MSGDYRASFWTPQIARVMSASGRQRAPVCVRHRKGRTVHRSAPNKVNPVGALVRVRAEAVLLDYRANQEDKAVTEILECLQKYGQRLDLEIAKETGVPLAAVRERLADLVATGAVIKCDLTRFEHGKRIEAWQCRVAGYVPPFAPGRKPKAPTT